MRKSTTPENTRRRRTAAAMRRLTVLALGISGLALCAEAVPGIMQQQHCEPLLRR